MSNYIYILGFWAVSRLVPNYIARFDGLSLGGLIHTPTLENKNEIVSAHSKPKGGDFVRQFDDILRFTS